MIVYSHSDVYTYTGAALHGVTLALCLATLIIVMRSRHAEKKRKESWTYWLGDTVALLAIAEILRTVGLAISADADSWVGRGTSIPSILRTQLILWFMGDFFRAMSYVCLVGAVMTLSSRLLHKAEPRSWKMVKYAVTVAAAALNVVVFIYLGFWISRYIGWVNAEQDSSLLGRLDSMLRNINIVYFVTGMLELVMALTGVARAWMVLGKVTARKKKMAARLLVVAASLAIIPAAFDIVFGAHTAFVGKTDGTDVYSSYNHSYGRLSVILGVIFVSWPIYAGLVCVFLAANRAWPGKGDKESSLDAQLRRFGPVPLATMIPR